MLTENEIKAAFEQIYAKVDEQLPPKEVAYSVFREGVLLSASSVCEATSDEFEEFWTMYDKKVGKDKCVKLWNKLSKSDRISCMEYIPCYKRAQPDKKYRKNPETFLRNKSWNDELIYSTDEVDIGERVLNILKS